MLEQPRPNDPYWDSGTGEDCHECGARAFCLTTSIDDACIRRLHKMIRKRGPYEAQRIIYREGHPVRSLFAIQTGSVKTETVTAEGRRIIGEFLFEGDLLGVEGIGSRHYAADAVALEETWLCELPMHALEDACRKAPELQHELLGRLGRLIRAGTLDTAAQQHMTADKRLLRFIIHLYHRRQSKTQRSDRCVHLPMDKQDIAVYLGLTPESLSRALRKLERTGAIRNHLRCIELLLDPEEAAAGDAPGYGVGYGS